MKEKLTPENVFENSIASSIIFALGYYVNNIGLEQKHLRYLLMDNYATPEQINNDIQLEHNIDEMKNFFEQNKKFDFYYGKGLIKSRAHLNYYLNLLSKPPLNIIEKKPFTIRHKYSPKTIRNKYFLTAKGIGELYRKICIKNLNDYDNNNIVSFYEKIIAGKNKGINYNQVFYGITKEERASLSDTDKKMIEELRNIISICLLKINDIIKKSKTNRIEDMTFVQIFKSSDFR